MKQGRYAEACPKLEAARNLFAGPGILLNLGDCYEHTNRTASAWSAFAEAAVIAKRTGRAAEESEANRRRAMLDARICKLVIRVPLTTRGLVIRRDGSVVDPSQWGTPVPVDPGPHSVTADIEGGSRWVTTTSVTEPGTTVAVQVPEDVRAPAPPPESPPPSAPTAPTLSPTRPSEEASLSSALNLPVVPERPTESSHWTSHHTLAVIAAGSGVAALAVGGILEFSAKSQYDTAQNETGTARHEDSLSAVSTGNVATLVIGAGAVLAATGAVLWLTAPSRHTVAGTNGNQLFVRGSF